MKRNVRKAMALAFVLMMWITPAFGQHGAKGPGVDRGSFDGTDPLNQPHSGVVCGPGTRAQADSGDIPTLEYTYHVSASSPNTNSILTVLRESGTTLFFHVLAGSPLQITQVDTRPVRIIADGNIGGQVSATGKQVFCIGCDTDSEGDAACDVVIPN